MNINLKVAANMPKANNEVIVLALKTGKSIMLASALSAQEKKFAMEVLKEQPYLLAYESNVSLVYLDKNQTKKILLVGMGDEKDLNAEKIRMFGGSLARLCRAQKMTQPCLLIPDKLQKKAAFVQTLAEGILLGSYTFTEYKSKKDADILNAITVISSEATNIRNQVRQAQIIAESVNLARDLINRPGNDVYPAKIAEVAKQVAARTGLTYKVLEQKDMEKLGMGALLSVSKGSVQLPKLIVLEYNGNKKSKLKTAFVGKGITFDSGGISIKPSEGMGEMKDDMGGAAAVLGAIQAVCELKLPVNITAVIPCAENMPSGEAARPGDIVKSAAGKTIEIISTDAEGRMILADAVWYAGEKLGAQNIVDIATLTGAASVALGEFVAGVVTNNQNLCDKVMAASYESGEKCWQMPAFEEYKEYNKSDVADIKNSGGRFGGMITGGLFIGEFTQKAWVHIDIGNTVTTKVTKGYNVKGPVGFGVRLLLETARQLL